ncbi:response regulator [Actinomycetospora cinnamomea]|uniref:Response regulator receiver domain-containing protein n=1 Tax=Actinomycetospora cinnamomea TaxID=663609 RepID=A0A2U1FIA6_9PSEU|nr:response regulator [Actinomycetospora cinnamomea]PVZ11923.1 response regulator receiver domain-containing protein [Actinomycetospora cinnamomea]
MGALVLVVEDSPQDVEAVRRTLTRAYPEARLECVEDGTTALERLADEEGERPDLVLLDLNVPGLDGHGVLTTVRRRSQLDELPVVVLTSSTHPRDIEACYRAGANSYVFKPVDLAMFQVVLRGIFACWLGTPADGTVNQNELP